MENLLYLIIFLMILSEYFIKASLSSYKLDYSKLDLMDGFHPLKSIHPNGFFNKHFNELLCCECLCCDGHMVNSWDAKEFFLFLYLN